MVPGHRGPQWGGGAGANKGGGRLTPPRRRRNGVWGEYAGQFIFGVLAFYNTKKFLMSQKTPRGGHKRNKFPGKNLKKEEDSQDQSNLKKGKLLQKFLFFCYKLLRRALAIRPAPAPHVGTTAGGRGPRPRRRRTPFPHAPGGQGYHLKIDDSRDQGSLPPRRPQVPRFTIGAMSSNTTPKGKAQAAITNPPFPYPQRNNQGERGAQPSLLPTTVG